MYDIEMEYDELHTRIAMVEGRNCDKYDYLIAVFCGVVAGFVDCVFVGKPNGPQKSQGTNSILGSWTDEQTEKIAERFADFQMKKDYEIFNQLKIQGYKGQELRDKLREKGVPENLRKAGYHTFQEKISYLENKYSVCYDNSVDKEYGLTPFNHHLKSLSHCPDILGLCCSIIDQFSYTTTVFDSGRLVQLVPTKRGVELRGTTLISKLYCAICNWFGHLFSDFCGSHSAKGRGMGIPIPFFELFQLCDFGDISVSTNEFDGEVNRISHFTVAEISVKVFENGYDARFAMAMAIPVLLEELLIRFLWSIKQYFYHKRPWNKCIPDKTHPDLRLMLIVGNGALCLVDGTDALFRAKGNPLEFILHLNIIAWFQLTLKVIREIQIRFSFTYEDLKLQYEYLNHQLNLYISRLKAIDYEQYQQQLKEVDKIGDLLEIGDFDTANQYMTAYVKNKGIDCSFADEESFMRTMLESDEPLKF